MKMMSSIKKRIRAQYAQLKNKYRIYRSDKLYVSFGENCLADNILERYHLKSFTTPFSHGRSNVEYILQLEADQYRDFVNVKYLSYGELLSHKKVPRLNKYNQIKNDYSPIHKNGFEFTHHDVIQREDLRLKMEERVERLHQFIGKKRYIIFYHHRTHNGTNIPLLLNDLNQLKEKYSTDKKKSEAVCFTQQWVATQEERECIYTKEYGVHFFILKTRDMWEGEDEDIFWARHDDDLIAEMMKTIQQL